VDQEDKRPWVRTPVEVIAWMGKGVAVENQSSKVYDSSKIRRVGMNEMLLE